jgi:catalase
VKKILKKLLIGLIAALLMLVAFIAFHLQTHAVVTTEEVIPEGEPEQIQMAAKQAEGIIEGLKTTYAARGVHAKGHACVKALVDVNQNIATQLQYGVFAKTGTRYKAWIRFSNSGSNMANADDRAKDARGMAIKLLNAGQNLNHEKNLNGGTTQEFIAHNSPAFFVTSVDDYNQFVATKGDPLYFIQGYNPFKWRLRELWQLVTAYAPPPKSPLWTQYFSNTAYKLGPNNIKFMMQSCETTKNLAATKTDDADFLKHTLSQELAKGDACMQLMVQLQDAHKKMPIEDATILWKESDSPFLPVAKITILKQAFDTPEQQQFCENLSFSPWNALEAHRPIGALNRARKWVYEASSNYRHQANKTQVPQSLDW